jgi:glycine/D-amino acid oxidase-like deaminating enzyme
MSTSTGPGNIVVVGGGIAGITTAYYLATHPKRPSGSKVTVIEGTKVAAGASGYSGGFLAKDWHGSATSSTLCKTKPLISINTALTISGLSAMSYDLHKELSDNFGGAEKWGYRTVETLVCV